jgi:lipopolysaccharide transport protein LptA
MSKNIHRTENKPENKLSAVSFSINILKNYLPALILLLSYATNAHANSQLVFTSKAQKTSLIITTIKSNQVQRLDNKMILSDQVTLTRDGIKFLADQMTVFYNDDNKQTILTPSNNIARVNAEKNVRIYQGEFSATGNYGFYDPKKGIFAIEENVIFNNGASVIHGEKFIYNLNSQKGYLSSANQSQF